MLNKELTFTQAETLNLFFKASQTKRQYQRACLKIGKNGKSLEWDKDINSSNLEYVMLDIINLYLKSWNIICNGVLRAVDTSNKRSFDIIVIKNLVKIFENNVIKDIR